ncbi:zinc-binding dehydrogenase [Rhizobium sp. YJ-22]|uniref:zinc-binding dehydrogenase n=1 Tax=Rhizobium sp. YJ-22 TaxID=3037556 RepID=UPI00241293DA|nr:zinc-binding dehydrogenase [Rhizobium sp. YJ-22]MDG3576737.1 zinc-binding dehydrogenase [Rhizobium sp. YJ-22]
MKAAVLYNYNEDLVIEDVPLGDPGDREVLVRIVATGVCHSDLSAAKGKSLPPLPIILGHEAAGIVERTGSAVSKVRKGDHVILSWAPNCGECFYCHKRLPTMCDTYGAAAGGGTLWNGARRLGTRERPIHHFTCLSSFAELAVVPESACSKIAEDVPFEVAALVGCAVTTGFGAVVNDARVEPGEVVGVIGVGGVGINAIQAAALAGAEAIAAIDINPEKEAVARAFGATHFVNSATQDVVAELKVLSRGRGADSIVDCTGRPAAIALAYDGVRLGGSVVSVGIAARGEMVCLPASTLPNTQKRIIGSNYGGGVPERDFERILALYRAGRFELDRQVGKRVALEAINDAFRWLEQGVLARTLICFDH